MAVEVSIKSNKVAWKLNNGMHSGVVVTLSVPFAKLSNAGYDNQKAFNVAAAASSIFAKAIYGVEHTRVESLSAGE